MICIDNPNTDPYLNHAIEEHLLETQADECFMLWSNRPCILLGRNQNAYAEINSDYVRSRGLDVVRRITGGGAVFNDGGNFNFTFIGRAGEYDFGDFKRFTAPVISALQSLGVPAELKGRNDLIIDGKKFSGNAQSKVKDRLLHHGTLLFDTDLEALAAALNVNALKLESKGISSVKSRVTNIDEHLKSSMTAAEFRAYLFDYVLRTAQGAVRFELTAHDFAAAEKIAAAKYRQNKWNYGQKLNFSLVREKRFAAGLVQAGMSVSGGIIERINFSGDFFGEHEISGLESALAGCAYSADAVLAALKGMDTDIYIKGVSAEELASLIV